MVVKTYILNLRKYMRVRRSRLVQTNQKKMQHQKYSSNNYNC